MAKYGGAGIRDAGKKPAPYQLKPGQVPSGKVAATPLMTVGKQAGKVPAGANPTLGKKGRKK